MQSLETLKLYLCFPTIKTANENNNNNNNNNNNHNNNNNNDNENNSEHSENYEKNDSMCRDVFMSLKTESNFGILRHLQHLSIKWYICVQGVQIPDNYNNNNNNNNNENDNHNNLSTIKRITDDFDITRMTGYRQRFDWRPHFEDTMEFNDFIMSFIDYLLYFVGSPNNNNNNNHNNNSNLNELCLECPQWKKNISFYSKHLNEMLISWILQKVSMYNIQNVNFCGIDSSLISFVHGGGGYFFHEDNSNNESDTQINSHLTNVSTISITFAKFTELASFSHCLNKLVNLMFYESNNLKHLKIECGMSWGWNVTQDMLVTYLTHIWHFFQHIKQNSNNKNLKLLYLKFEMMTNIKDACRKFGKNDNIKSLLCNIFKSIPEILTKTSINALHIRGIPFSQKQIEYFNFWFAQPFGRFIVSDSWYPEFIFMQGNNV